MTDEHDPNNVRPFPGVRRLPVGIQRILREQQADADRDLSRVLARVEDYRRLCPPGTNEEVLFLSALIHEMSSLQGRTRDLERRLEALERLHELP